MKHTMNRYVARMRVRIENEQADSAPAVEIERQTTGYSLPQMVRSATRMALELLNSRDIRGGDLEQLTDVSINLYGITQQPVSSWQEDGITYDEMCGADVAGVPGPDDSPMTNQ